MDALDPDAERELDSLLADFAAERLRPVAGSIRSGSDADTKLRRELHQMGVVPAVSEAYGGQGAIDAGAQLRLLDRLATGDAGFALEVGAVAQVARIVEDAGTAAQRDRILGRLATEPGLTATVAYHEGFGRSPSELRTTATPDGDGWVLDGIKRTVVRPDARLRLVVATVAGGGLAAFDISAAEGVSIEVDEGEAGLIGFRSVRTGTLRLSGVRLPADALVGAADSLPLHRAVAWCRLVPATVAVAVAASARDYATAYALEREAFGRKIIDYQGVEFPLAESDMAIEAASLSIRSAWHDIAASSQRAQIARLTTDAVHFATTTGYEVATVAVNTLGGHGYLVDHPVERWYREATLLSALDYDLLAATAGPGGITSGVARAW